MHGKVSVNVSVAWCSVVVVLLAPAAETALGAAIAKRPESMTMANANRRMRMSELLSDGMNVGMRLSPDMFPLDCFGYAAVSRQADVQPPGTWTVGRGNGWSGPGELARSGKTPWAHHPG